MLKLTYTNDNFSLEYVNQSWETWINTRVILALRSGCNIHLQNTTASFLIELDSSKLAQLTRLATQDNKIQICHCDTNLIEVTLKGTWISSNLESEEGVFITILNDFTELYLYYLEQKLDNRSLRY